MQRERATCMINSWDFYKPVGVSASPARISALHADMKSDQPRSGRTPSEGFEGILAVPMGF